MPFAGALEIEGLSAADGVVVARAGLGAGALHGRRASSTAAR